MQNRAKNKNIGFSGHILVVSSGKGDAMTKSGGTDNCCRDEQQRE
jgi:hypothetical protein